jgi:hypothetical protein
MSSPLPNRNGARVSLFAEQTIGVTEMKSTLVTRTARETHTQVTTGKAEELALDDCGGLTNWYTICEAHGTAIGHATKALANMFAPVPTQWCEYCAGSEQWCVEHNEPANCCHSNHNKGEK